MKSNHNRANEIAKAFIIIGITLFFVSGSNLTVFLWSAYGTDPNIWWTHNDMKLSAEEGLKHTAYFLDGKPLANLMQEGKVYYKEAEGKERAIKLSGLRVRVNNYEKIKAQKLTFAVPSAFLFGLGIMSLLAGLVLRKYSASKAEENINN